MNNAFTTYNSTDVLTAQQAKLIIMMYDGAIRFAEESICRIHKKDIVGRGQFIGKTQNIVLELLNCLDRNKGGEIAKNLERLYLYINRNLTMANIRGNVKLLEDSIKILKELRKGWRQLQTADKTQEKKVIPRVPFRSEIGVAVQA